MAISFGEGAARVEELADQLDERLADRLDGAMADVAEEASRQLRLNDSVARRVLVNAIVSARKARVRPDTLVARGVYAPPWWRYLEYGTGARGEGRYPAPIVPPFEAIYEWIIAKDIEPRAESIDSRFELATVIQETIADVGTFSHPFARPAWYGPRGREHVVKEVADGMTVALRRSF